MLMALYSFSQDFFRAPTGCLEKPYYNTLFGFLGNPDWFLREVALYGVAVLAR